ncbi:hypothetical protein CQA88_32090, partial [Klebsiella pneumoniae]
LPPSADAGLSGDPAQSHRALIPIKCEALLWPLNGYSVNICLPPSADAGLSGDPAQSHRALIPIKCEALLWPLN